MNIVHKVLGVSKSVSSALRRLALGVLVPGILLGAGSAIAGAPAAINKYTGEVIPNGAVLLVWTGDGCATPLCSPLTSQDFISVVDAEPNSTTYGNVIWTAELPNILASNVAGNIVGLLGSDSHNDPHHMLSYTSYISGGGDGLVKGRKYTLAGGVISKNVFRFDITSVRNIGKAEVAVCGTQPKRSSLTDDFVVMPAPGGNHKILYTYMGNYGYGPQGTVTEIEPGRVAPTAVSIDTVTNLVDAAGVTNLLDVSALTDQLKATAGKLTGAVETAGLSVCTPSIPNVVALAETVELLSCLSNEIDPADDDALLGHKGITEYSGCVKAKQSRNPTNYTSSPDLRDSRKANQGLFFLGNTDAGIESVPHGMALTYDGKYLATSDYAVPASIGAAAINGALSVLCSKGNGVLGVSAGDLGPLGICGSTYGASVRVWETSNSYTYGKTKDALKKANVYDDNPYIRSVSAVPDGPRQEDVLFHEENEGLMAFGLPHRSHHCVGQKGWVNLGDPSYDASVTRAGVAANDASKVTVSDCTADDASYVPHDGAFSASMCGGVLYYSPDIRLSGKESNVYGGVGPYWRPVYDVGPCSGVSYFSISDDDRFLILPISGIQSPPAYDSTGSSVFDRDYPREHSRRMLTVDVRPLIAKGHADTAATKILCDYPEADASRAANTSLGILAQRSNQNAGASARFNVLKHNNEADDCPRIRGAIGQFETGPNGSGLPTTVSSNTSEPGTGYLRLVGAVDNPLGISLNATQTGGEPSGDGGSPGSGNINSPQNLYTHGGPHFTLIDRVGYQQTPAGGGGYLDLSPLKVNGLGLPRDQVVGKPEVSGTSRYVFIQYFVELQHVPLPGTGNDGDRTICLGKFDRKTGATILDTSFTDELLGTPCLDFDSAARDSWTWPGARGAKGSAKPHAAAFERDGAALFGPGYYPEAPLNPDGDL